MFQMKRVLRRTPFPAGLALVAFATATTAQERPGPLVLSIHALKGGAYWVEGGVSNTGFIVGDNGVVVIDAQKTVEAARKTIAEIAKVTSRPINAVILTHADPDHVGGLPAYPRGAVAIAQENTRSEIRISAADPNGGPIYGPMYRALLPFLPVRTVAGSER